MPKAEEASPKPPAPRAEEEPVVAVELSAAEKIEELNNQLKDGTIGPHKVRRPSSVPSYAPQSKRRSMMMLAV